MGKEPFWRQAARVFDERAALQELATPLLGPKLEICVGPGRFAEALGVEFGIDSALAPLILAKRREGLVSQAGFAVLVAGPVP